MRTGATSATEDGHFLRGIENLCKPCNFFFRRADPGLGLLESNEWSARGSFLQCNISRENNDCDAERNCSSHCNLKDPRNLISVGNQLTILTALPEQKLRVSLLKVSAPDFSYGNMCCNCQDRHPATIAIVESINQVRVSRSAAPSAYSKFSCEVRFGSSCEGGSLLMANVHPGNIFVVFSYRISNSIQRIARDTVYPLYSCCF